MNIYHISQDVNDDWNTYDSAIVAAVNETEARKIHPDRLGGKWWEEEHPDSSRTWASRLEDVVVVHIGKVDGPLEYPQGHVFCSSFNAG